MSESLKLQVDRRDGLAVVYTEGYINNQGGEEIASTANKATSGGGYKVLLLNLQGTKIVNSIGISILIEIIEKMLEIDGKLAFCCLTPTIEKTFHIMGLAQYAGIYADEPAGAGRRSATAAPPPPDSTSPRKTAQAPATTARPSPAPRRLARARVARPPRRRRACLRRAPARPVVRRPRRLRRGTLRRARGARPRLARAPAGPAELLREVVVGEGPFPASLKADGGGAPGRGRSRLLHLAAFAGGMLVARPAARRAGRRRSRRSHRAAPPAARHLGARPRGSKSDSSSSTSRSTTGWSSSSRCTRSAWPSPRPSTSSSSPRRSCCAPCRCSTPAAAPSTCRDGDAYRLDRTFGGEARDRFAADDPALEPFLAGKGAGPEELLPGAAPPDGGGRSAAASGSAG